MEQQVTLYDMLDAREKRALRQKELLSAYQKPLLCFTMNIAGPVKNNTMIRDGFALGKRYLEERLNALHAEPVFFEGKNAPTGCEAFYVIDLNPLVIKQITTDIEDGTAPGRLFDMDVLCPDGKKVERTELGLSERKCLLCGAPAKECARSRTHSVQELQEKTMQILEQALRKTDAQDIARLACCALLYEVATTPKPGLVDRAGNGSHKDMDIFTFFDSASALYPYFEACAQTGRKTASASPAETFSALRGIGRKAESDMFAATKGVNTHKGAIFSVGIVCAALGRLPRADWNNTGKILEECAAMTKGLVAADFKNLTPETAETTGQKLYLQYQIAGIRGQMEEGLPAVKNAGLPVLKEGLTRGLSLNDAGCAALLALITASVDTNLIARSDLATQQETVRQLKELLQKTPYPDRETLEKLDRDFIEKNLSPGGSADLLSICYLLYFLESEA